MLLNAFMYAVLSFFALFCYTNFLSLTINMSNIFHIHSTLISDIEEAVFGFCIIIGEKSILASGIESKPLY